VKGLSAEIGAIRKLSFNVSRMIRGEVPKLWRMLAANFTLKTSNSAMMALGLRVMACQEINTPLTLWGQEKHAVHAVVARR